MTSDEIAAIVAKHEMQRIELKESFDVECIETACAFANAHGGLIDMTIEMLRDPLHASRPRNHIVAQALYDMGIIEHYGRGIRRIQDACRANGNESPEWYDRVGEFLTVYKARNATQTPSKSTQEPENTTLSSVNTTQRKRRLTAVQQSILEYLSKHPQATRKEVAGGLGSVTEDGVKYSLVRLQSLGLLKRVGPDFGGHWEIVEKSSPTGGKDIDS